MRQNRFRVERADDQDDDLDNDEYSEFADAPSAKRKKSANAKRLPTDADDDDELSGGTEHFVSLKGKKGSGSGGFQTMGLSAPLLRGITRKGFKVPTPIQRKCVPLVLEGKDVVGMARTGSGKVIFARLCVIRFNVEIDGRVRHSDAATIASTFGQVWCARCHSLSVARTGDADAQGDDGARGLHGLAHGPPRRR